MITIDNVLIEIKVDRLLVSSSSESLDFLLVEMQEMGLTYIHNVEIYKQRGNIVVKGINRNWHALKLLLDDIESCII